MNKTRKYAMSFIAISAAAIASSAFASSSNYQTFRERPGMSQSGTEAGSGFLSRYLKTDLTDTEKTAAQTIAKTNMDAVRAAMEANGTGTVTDATKATLATIQSDFIAAITSYVATDKLDALKADLAHMGNRPDSGSGSTNHKGKPEFGSGSEKPESGSGQIRNGKSSKKSTQTSNAKNASTALQTKMSVLVEAKMVTMSSDADRISWLEGVSDKLDTIIAKLNSTKQKKTYQALQDAISDKLDELNGTTADTSSSIESVLE